MGRIEAIFAQLGSAGAGAESGGRPRRRLMPFICGGFPSPELTGPLIEAMDRAGSAVIEVGFPYSDPIADGPVIATAMRRALSAGVTPPVLFEQVAEVRPRIGAGLVAMVSVSIVQGLGGPKRFATEALAAGFDGLIVPDAPLEACRPIRRACAELGLDLALLIAPTSPPRRARRIAEASSGFIYLLARTGTTGERADLPELAQRVEQIRRWTSLPIAVGFGISTAEQVRAAVACADAAIVGSALVRAAWEARQGGQDVVAAVENLSRRLCEGLDGPGPGRRV